MNKLEKQIEKHRKFYYNRQPEITDEEFDALVDQLKKEKPNSPVLNKTGANPEEGNGWDKKRHQMPMFSLNKVNNYEQLEEWSREVDAKSYYFSEKLDGISIQLLYQNGFLQQAVTRGDGKIGEDIFQNVRMMQGVPYSINTKDEICFRGEIVLEHEKWERHFSSYSNPRNAASGIARLEERKKAKEKCKHLKVFVYDTSSEFQTESQKFNFIQKYFETPNHSTIPKIKVAESLYKKYEEEFREELNYDIDGLVFRVNEKEKFEKAGQKNNRPFGAMALKFASEKAVTKIKDIKWQVGTTGRVTPVAHLDPVKLVGAKIQRASLYNASYIEEELGGLYQGDDVVVERANDVIPRVLSTFGNGKGNKLKKPKYCPDCSSGLVKDGEYLICIGDSCPSQILGDFQRWVESLDLKGIGDSILQMIITNCNKIEDVADLYSIKIDDIKDLKNKNDAILGEKRAKQIIKELHDNKEPLLCDFLGGLNIAGLRSKTAQKIVDEFSGDAEKVIQQLFQQVSFKGCDGVGTKKSKQIRRGLAQKKKLIEKLLSEAEICPQRPFGGALKGKTFCITGRLSKRRSEVQKDIREAGGEPRSGVSESLDYLVTNNPNSSSNKLKKTKKYGIEIISESELYRMI